MYIRDIKERRYRETGTCLSLSPSLSINSIYITVNIHFFFPFLFPRVFPPSLSLSRSKREESIKIVQILGGERERERGISWDVIAWRNKKKEERRRRRNGGRPIFNISVYLSLSFSSSMVLIRYIQCIHIRLYCDIPVPFQLETICDEGLSVVLTSFRYLKFLNRHRYPSKKNQLYLISLTFFLFRFLHSEIFHVPIIIVTTFIIYIIPNCDNRELPRYKTIIYIYIYAPVFRSKLFVSFHFSFWP